MRWVGIEQDGDTFLAAQLCKKGSTIAVEKLEVWESPTHVKQLYKMHFQNLPFCSGLRSSEVLLKPVETSVSSKKQMKKILPFQIESLTFLKSSDFLYVPVWPDSSEPGKVEAFITTSHSLRSHLAFWEKQQMDPEQVSFYPMALVRYVQSQLPETKEGLLVHLADSSTLVVYMKNELPFKSFNMDLGWSKIQRALSKEKISEELLLEKNEEEKKFYAWQLAMEWQKQLRRIFQSFQLPKKLPLFLTGMPTEYPNWIYAMVSEYAEKPSVNFSNPTFAIAIGLAKNALLQDAFSLQFRQKELLPKRFFYQVGRRFLGTFSLLFLLAISILLWQVYTLKKHRAYLKEVYEEAYFEDRESMGKASYSLTESTHSLKEKMADWEKQLDQEILFSQIEEKKPWISSLLNWLSHHPTLASSEIQLEKIDYELKSYPSLSNPNQKYLPWMELTLQTKNPDLWKQFFHALSTENPLVNPKKEIHWEQQNSVYIVNFYLKTT